MPSWIEIKEDSLILSPNELILAGDYSFDLIANDQFSGLSSPAAQINITLLNPCVTIGFDSNIEACKPLVSFIQSILEHFKNSEEQ